MNTRLIRLLAAAAAALLLWGCGGGGDDGRKDIGPPDCQAQPAQCK